MTDSVLHPAPQNPALHQELHSLRSDSQALWANAAFLREVLTLASPIGAAPSTDTSDAIDAMILLAERVGRRAATLGGMLDDSAVAAS